MLLPINSQYLGFQKVDICFFDALRQHINNQKCSIGFFIVRFLISIWLLVSHLLNKDTDDVNIYRMVSWLFVMMIIFNFGAFIYAFWTYHKFLTNGMFLNRVAQRIQHCQIIDESSAEDIMSYYEPYPGMGLKVSKECYQFENNILTNQVDEEYKKRAQRNCLGLISQQICFNSWIRLWTQSFNLASISMFTYTIILLSQGKGITQTQQTFIYMYLFTEVCSRLIIYLILFLIGISPLFCFIVCVWACFFKKQTKIQLPPTQQATIQIVKQCEGNCPVCYQDVKLNEKVVILNCSPKHVFHELCIKGWTHLRKNTCPICRATI